MCLLLLEIFKGVFKVKGTLYPLKVHPLWSESRFAVIWLLIDMCQMGTYRAGSVCGFMATINNILSDFILFITISQNTLFTLQNKVILKLWEIMFVITCGLCVFGWISFYDILNDLVEQYSNTEIFLNISFVLSLLFMLYLTLERTLPITFSKY